jgi:hypothetical protein
VPGRPSTFQCLFVGLSPLCALPSAGAAQGSVEVVPYVGVYLPTQNLVDHPPPGNVWGYSPQLSLKQKAGIALGGRLTVWWSSRLGAEATLGYSSSDLSAVTIQLADSSAHVITASARALMRISPTGGGPPLLRLGAGIGFLSRGGGAYLERGTTLRSVCGTSRFAGVVSAGTGFTFGRGRVALRLDAENYMYPAGLYVNGEYPGCGTYGTSSQCRGFRNQVCNIIEAVSPTNRFQDDLILSVGLALRLGAR